MAFFLLDCPKVFELLGRNLPSDKQQMIKLMEEYGLITARDDIYDILNLGAILFAKQFKDFPTLKGKEIIVRRYQGTNNRILSLEYICQTGYAIGFKDLVDFVGKNTSTESIEVRREAIPSYPIVAIRELTANMMVHQDTAIMGMPLTIEIFTNRLTFTNPGSSLNDVNRLIDLPPHSRNEAMAQIFILYTLLWMIDYRLPPSHLDYSSRLDSIRFVVGSYFHENPHNKKTP